MPASGLRVDTGSVSQIGPQFCTLRLVAEGRAEPCPREGCVFWEAGGAVVQGGCLIERLAVDVHRPDLAASLLATREHLERERKVPNPRALLKSARGGTPLARNGRRPT